MALIGFSIVLLHLILGFGFLIYKLLPVKKQVGVETPIQEQSNKKTLSNSLK